MFCPRARLLVVSAVGGAWFVCGCASYTTTIDRTVRRGDLQVTLESARITVQRHALNPEPSGKTTLTLVVDQVPRDVTLLDAGIGKRGESPCLTRMEAKVGRERGRPADAPLEPGERLVLGFSSVDRWSL